MRPTLTHIALHVPDLDACIAFYRDYCAMQVIHERAGKGSRIVWLAEPGKEHSFIFVLMPGGQARQLGRVAAGEHLKVRRGFIEQLGVERVILFSNQNTHGSNLSKTVQTAARILTATAHLYDSIEASAPDGAPVDHIGSLRRSSSSGKCSMYSSSGGGICR